MAPRANWKGYLKLSLVTCAVALFPATTNSERVGLHYIDRRTRHRLRQQYFDPETDEVVDKEDRVRGYEVGRGEYVPIEEGELERLRIASAHTIEIESFVDRADVDELYFDAHYFLAPEDKVGEEAFVVIRDAMRSREVAGLAKVVLYGRERVLLLEARGRGLLGSTLHYEYEVRDEKTYFGDIPQIKVSSEMLDLAAHIIDGKKGAFDPAQFKDNYQEALVDLVHAKQAGRPVSESAKESKPNNVINLMDALKRSLATNETPRASAPKVAKRGSPTRRSRPSASRGARSTTRTRRRKAG